MRSRIALFAIVAAALVTPTGAFAQSTRTGPALGVARISVVSGDVATMRGDSGDWVTATVNMPVVEGDSVQSGIGSRTEIQLDHGNFVRLWNDTEVQLLELASQKFRLRLIQGTVIYSELPNSVSDIDIETPLAAVRPMKSGRYRITVGPGETIITARQGRADVAFEATVSNLTSGRTMTVREGSNEPEVETAKAGSQDSLDKWAVERDRRLRWARSYRYLSRDIYGADALDDHGDWRYVAGVGYSWFPRAGIDWVPYRHGRWIWIDYYGWTWVGSEPWGWAPYHWGRWYRHATFGWGWYPGAQRLRHVWRPALVAFFGFEAAVRSAVWSGFGGIGWCPLAPGEVFVPWYGHRYYAGGNSILVDNSVNIFNNYRNARGYRGLSYVNAQDFGRGSRQTPRSVRVANSQRGVAIRGPVPVVPARSSQGTLVQARGIRDGSALRSLRTTRPLALRDGTARVSFASQQERLRNSVNSFHTTYRSPQSRSASASSVRAATGDGATRSPAAIGTRDATASPVARSPYPAGASPTIRGQRPSGTASANPGVRARSASVRTSRPSQPAPGAGTRPPTVRTSTLPSVFAPRTRSRIGAVTTSRGSQRNAPGAASPPTPAVGGRSGTSGVSGVGSRSSRSGISSGSRTTATGTYSPPGVGRTGTNRIGSPATVGTRSPIARPPAIGGRTSVPRVGAPRTTPTGVFVPRPRSRVGSRASSTSPGSGANRRPTARPSSPTFGGTATRGPNAGVPSRSRVPAIGSRSPGTARQPSYSPGAGTRSRSATSPSTSRTSPQIRPPIGSRSASPGIGIPRSSRSSGGGYSPSRSRVGSKSTGRTGSPSPSARSPSSPRPPAGGSRSYGSASRPSTRTPSSVGTIRSNARRSSSSARSSSPSSTRRQDR